MSWSGALLCSLLHQSCFSTGATGSWRGHKVSLLLVPQPGPCSGPRDLGWGVPLDLITCLAPMLPADTRLPQWERNPKSWSMFLSFPPPDRFRAFNAKTRALSQGLSQNTTARRCRSLSQLESRALLPRSRPSTMSCVCDSVSSPVKWAVNIREKDAERLGVVGKSQLRSETFQRNVHPIP